MVGAAGWDLWAFWSGLPVVFVCAGWGCRRGRSPLLQHQFYGLGPLPPSLGNLALSCMRNFLFSQLDSFHRLLDIDRSFPLRNNTCTCPPFLPATSLPLYLIFNRKTLQCCQSVLSLLIHPSKQPGFWLLALWRHPNHSHQGANDLLQPNPVDTSVLVVDFSALMDSAHQFLIFRNRISLCFPNAIISVICLWRLHCLLASYILEFCNT